MRVVVACALAVAALGRAPVPIHGFMRTPGQVSQLAWAGCTTRSQFEPAPAMRRSSSASAAPHKTIAKRSASLRAQKTGGGTGGGTGGLVSAGPWDVSVSLQSLCERQAAFAQERTWDQHHTPRNLALAMVGEVGELCECFQWRPDAATAVGLPGWSDADKEHLGEEMSDVLLYLVRLADKCDVDLAEAVVKKIEKNAAKYPAGLVKGSSAKYTAYQNAGKGSGDGGRS